MVIVLSPNKMGRPKSDNPKEFDVKVRLDRNTHTELLEYCEKNHTTKANAIRKGIRMLLNKEKTS